MGFNPPIPTPNKNIRVKNTFGKHKFKLSDVEDMCNLQSFTADDQQHKITSTLQDKGLNFDFYSHVEN
jgi:hypothetical protein